MMNVDKAKKRIEKYIKKGFKGYPLILIEYVGKTQDIATEVIISLTLEEGEEPQTQRFSSKTDAREDETIQSVIVKTIELTNANTVTQVDGISLSN